MTSALRRAWVETCGWSLIEVMFVIGLVGLLSGMAVLGIDDVVERAREWGAVRFVAGRVRLLRAEAVQRSRAVAWQFVRGADGVQFRVCVDGDGDGVRTADLAAGVDRALGPWEVLGERFTGLTFGLAVSGPGIEAGDASVEAGGDPLRVGAADMVTFGADGAGSSGTLFVCSRRGRQFAVRVNGLTGRVRVFEYQAGAGRWLER
jgi:hypothetical protein